MKKYTDLSNYGQRTNIACEKITSKFVRISLFPHSNIFIDSDFVIFDLALI